MEQLTKPKIRFDKHNSTTRCRFSGNHTTTERFSATLKNHGYEYSISFDVEVRIDGDDIEVETLIDNAVVKLKEGYKTTPSTMEMAGITYEDVDEWALEHCVLW